MTRGPASPPRKPRDRWRRWWLAIFALVLLVTIGFFVGHRLKPDQRPVSAPASVAPTVTPVTTAPTPEATTTTPAPSKTASLLQLPGTVPTHGKETFQYATRTGRILGTKGPLRRFRVAVENGSGEDVEAFANLVEATLGDARSWTGGGTLRLQLVGSGRPYDFTVYLATRTTAGEMCLRGGTNIVIGGRPYTSCRTTGKAILNLDRWRLSSKPYLSAKIPLATYRQYVINHEVGHELGHHHVGCPKAGGAAPVMVQQTITLRGCVANAWPRHGNSFLTGPPL